MFFFPDRIAFADFLLAVVKCVSPAGTFGEGPEGESCCGRCFGRVIFF